MNVPFVDLTISNDRFERLFLPKLKELITTGQFIKGKTLEEFESDFANFIGSQYCIGENQMNYSEENYY